MKAVGLIDGRLIDLNENIIPMEDRGYQFGDGVYEVTHVYNGRCFSLKPHMDRLFRSLSELKIPAVYSFAQLKEFHELLIKESGITDGGIYLQITRGTAPRAHHFPENVVPCLTMSLRPGSSSGDKLRESGAKAITVNDVRWLRCDIKSLNLLGNVMAKQAAKEADCYEAVMIRDGIVMEGSSSNLFVVKDGALWTHPISNLILKGIIRTLVVEKMAPKLGLKVVEKTFDMDFVREADECILTGSSTEIMPVVSIDGRPVADGKVGPLTRKLQEAYKELVREECF